MSAELSSYAGFEAGYYGAENALCDCSNVVREMKEAFRRQIEAGEGPGPCSVSEPSTWDVPVWAESGVVLSKEHGPTAFFREGWTVALHIVGLVGVVMAVLSMARTLCRNRQALWQLLRCKNEQALVAEGLQEKVLEVKVGQLRALLQLCCYGLVPLTVWVPFWSNPWDANRAAVICLVQPLLAACALFPRLVSPRSFDVVCCAAAALLTLTPWWKCCEDQLLLMLGLVNGVMMALVYVRRTMPRKVPVLLLMNVPFGLATSSIIMLRGKLIFGEWRAVGAVGQSLLVLLMTAAAPLLERRGRLWMFQLLELEELQEAFAASQCLLRSCFDVVVELGADGCIVSSGPELGALLLRERQCMQGVNFPELLEEEERSEFLRRLMASTARDLGLAESTQLSIKDACSNSLRLEVMWYEHWSRGAGGRAKHFTLGLREAPEQPHPRRVDEAPVLEEHGLPEARSVSSASSVVDTGALLVLDITVAGWAVRQATPSFRLRVGRLRRGAPFLERVARPERLRSWLTKALDARAKEEEQPPDCPLKLKMPSGKIKALCELAKSDAVDLDNVALLFHSIRAEDTEEAPATPCRNNGTSPRSSMSSLSDEESRPEPALLVLNAGVQGWPVLQVAPGFQATVGRLCHGASFLDVVSKPASFHSWLSGALEAKSSGAEPPADCRLTLLMPQGRVKLLCSLAVAEGALDIRSVPLLFREEERCPGGRRCSL